MPRPAAVPAGAAQGNDSGFMVIGTAKAAIRAVGTYLERHPRRKAAPDSGSP
jgi:hypothetical protein